MNLKRFLFPLNTISKICNMLYFFILLVIGSFYSYEFLSKSWNAIGFFDCLGFFGMICVAIGLVGTGYQWLKDYKASNNIC
ncbi:MAG: hypothetical protein Q8M40_01350 [Legionella sp.]|nr:hypothetical protein [Legionella sp.]